MMYTQGLMESMKIVSEIRASLNVLHNKITDDISGDDDTVFEQAIRGLEQVQGHLMNAGVEVQQYEAPAMRKVTVT